MHMGVYEARQHGTAGEVHTPGRWPSEALNFVVGPYREKPAVTNGNSLGDRKGWVRRDDLAADEDRIWMAQDSADRIAGSRDRIDLV
jgi:hypothetical protein